MKALSVMTAALLMLSAAPALAKSCCGGKDTDTKMCGKSGAAMNRAGRGKKGGCCCEGMGGTNMSRRI